MGSSDAKWGGDGLICRGIGDPVYYLRLWVTKRTKRECIIDRTIHNEMYTNCLAIRKVNRNVFERLNVVAYSIVLFRLMIDRVLIDIESQR